MHRSPLSAEQLLERLIAFDSTSHKSNLPIADFICDYLQGTLITRLNNSTNDKANILIQLGPNKSHDPAGGLMLCGHLDVVPATEPDWESDPFRLTKTSDRYVGRGVCDMKGFVALAVDALARRDSNQLTAPLALLLTYDEEPGTIGALDFACTWDRQLPLPRSTVVGEPTSLRVIRMHKGHLTIQLTCRGKSAHSGYPKLGVNALERMGSAVTALTAMKAELEAEICAHSEFFPEYPYVVLNLAQIRGGTAANIIPDHCSLTLGIRLLPGMNSSDYVSRIRNKLASQPGIGKFDLEVTADSPPLLTDDRTDIHRMLCKLVDQSDSLSASYATDAGPLQSLGLTPVIWGPGNIEDAHRPNESLSIREFAQAGQLLDRLISRCCTSSS